jgi:two-component system, cell cycle sensor histidine kinase and response regulator CckA
VKKAAALTRELLPFSRRQMLQPRIVDLNAMVAEMAKMLRRLLSEEIQLVIHLEPTIGGVNADPNQLEQVILNLAINARDAMPRGGILSIETARMELHEAYACQLVTIPPGYYVILAVRDTGSGMDAETQSHIFEPFFATKSPGVGTGLGLPTAYGIITQSGGYIEVDSTPGRGATFRIYLPEAVCAGYPDTYGAREDRCPVGVICPKASGAGRPGIVLDAENRVRSESWPF